MYKKKAKRKNVAEKNIESAINAALAHAIHM